MQRGSASKERSNRCPLKYMYNSSIFSESLPIAKTHHLVAVICILWVLANPNIWFDGPVYAQSSTHTLWKIYQFELVHYELALVERKREMEEKQSCNKWQIRIRKNGHENLICVHHTKVITGAG